ncbi:MAG: ribosome recycling factor [Rhodobacteraceae bacterium]|nr:ribosome recycling factor [Paracoccaceae bacterium]
MTIDDFELDLDDLERRMNGAIAALRKEFASLRSGRASAVMVEPIVVEAYGTRMPLPQCGSVNVPEPRLLSVSVWDKSIVSNVAKAIQDSGLGITPIVEGTVIRLPVPELNEQRRIELTRVAAQHAETARISIRNVRRDGMEQLRQAKLDGVSEDEVRLWSDEVQEITDKFIGEVDKALDVKRTEMMAV